MSVLGKVRARELAQMQAAGWQVTTDSAVDRLRAATRRPAGAVPARRDAERVAAARRRWLR